MYYNVTLWHLIVTIAPV